jgi:NADH:ubiquinone oxidoreductase subunit 4 (subunit M)
MGIASCLNFNQSMVGFQFLLHYEAAPLNNLTFTLGADGISMVFLLLTLFVFPICFASS